MDFSNLNEQEANNQLQATNKLLLEMVQNQKINAKNIIRVFIVTIGCYTLILLTIIICLFVYEGQFDVTDTETIRYEQETNSDDGGNAIGIINNSGDWSYGESETSDNDNEREDEIESK